MKREKVEASVKWGLGAVLFGLGLYAAGWLIVSTIQLAVVGVILLALYNYAPSVARAMATGNIKFMLWWVRENPIEELIMQRVDSERQIQKLAHSGASIKAETRNYADKVRGFVAKGFGNAEEYIETLARMHFVCNKQDEALEQAKKDLAQFDLVIEEAQGIWEMGLATEKANRLLMGFMRPDPMAQLRKRTALEAVQKKLNSSLSMLDATVRLNYSNVNVDDTVVIRDQLRQELLTKTVPVSRNAVIEQEQPDDLRSIGAVRGGIKADQVITYTPTKR